MATLRDVIECESLIEQMLHHRHAATLRSAHHGVPPILRDARGKKKHLGDSFRRLEVHGNPPKQKIFLPHSFLPSVCPFR